MYVHARVCVYIIAYILEIENKTGDIYQTEEEEKTCNKLLYVQMLKGREKE